MIFIRSYIYLFEDTLFYDDPDYTCLNWIWWVNCIFCGFITVFCCSADVLRLCVDPGETLFVAFVAGCQDFVFPESLLRGLIYLYLLLSEFTNFLCYILLPYLIHALMLLELY